MVPLAGDHAMNLSRAAAAALLLLALSSPVHAAQGTPVTYRETVTLNGDGTASVLVSLQAERPPSGEILIVTHGEQVADVNIDQPGVARASVRQSGGVPWIVLEFSAVLAAPVTIDVRFRVTKSDELFGAGAPHRSRRSTFRFRNPNGIGIDSYSASIGLPPGMVVGAVDDIDPPVSESSSRQAVTPAIRDGQRYLDVPARTVGPGEELRLGWRLREPRRTLTINLVLLAAGLIYLFWFRDLVRKPVDPPLPRPANRVA